jgi:hypothetical protein
MLDQFSNIAAEAANDSSFGSQSRERTVPIPQSITPVPGYPRKLVVFKIRASRFWQVRCWLNGKTHRKSTQSQSLRVAQSFARRYYELLLVNHLRQVDSIVVIENSKVEIKEVKTQLTFAAMTAQMFANEQARVERGEFSRLSLQVLHNRFDLHILPRWASWSVKKIDYKELLNFVQFLSKTLSSITVRQYLVGIRKVLKHAVAVGALDVLPEFPKVKIVTTPRGAFTPSEYWKIIRCARRLQNTEHPDSKKLLRKNFRLRYAEKTMPKDVAWAIGFMVNSFIRPSDLKTLKHRHVEVVKGKNTYLRLNLPETKSHSMPIVTLQPAVRIYEQLAKYHAENGLAKPDDYLFLPYINDRHYAHWVLAFYFNWVLAKTDLKLGPHGQERSLYSLRHSSITFRLLYGQGIDLLTLARNARTSVEVINNHYASTVTGEQNIALLQSRRNKQQ